MHSGHEGTLSGQLSAAEDPSDDSVSSLLTICGYSTSLNLSCAGVCEDGQCLKTPLAAPDTGEL